MRNVLSLAILLTVGGLSACYAPKNIGEYTVERHVRTKVAGELAAPQTHRLLRRWNNWNRSHLEMVSFREAGQPKKLVIASDQINDLTFFFNLLSVPSPLAFRERYADLRYTVLDSVQCQRFVDMVDGVSDQPLLVMATRSAPLPSSLRRVADSAPRPSNPRRVVYTFNDSLTVSFVPLIDRVNPTTRRYLTNRPVLYLNGRKHRVNGVRLMNQFRAFLRG